MGALAAHAGADQMGYYQCGGYGISQVLEVCELRLKGLAERAARAGRRGYQGEAGAVRGDGQWAAGVVWYRGEKG